MISRAPLVFVLMAFLFAMLPGCKVGPNYCRPRVCMPHAYRYAEESKQDFVDLSSWWDVFHDAILAELVEKALCGNYDLRSALERINELSAFYCFARAQLLPQVDGIIDTNRRLFSSNLAQFQFLREDQRTLNFLRFGMEVLWEIDLWGRLRRAKDAAYAEYEAQVEDARAVRIILISDVATGYIDVRTLEKKIRLLKELIIAGTDLLALQRERTASGIDSAILLQQTAAQLDASKSLLPTLEILSAQSKNGLALLLGLNPEEFVLCPVDSPAVPTAQISLDTGLPSDLLRRRPDIRKAERLLAAATERIGVAVADYFPRFNLLGSVDAASSYTAKWFCPGSLNWLLDSLGRWPLVDFGRVAFNVQAKESVQRQALLVYGQSVLIALRDVENALVAYAKEQERVTFLERRLCAVTKERDLKKDLFHSGLADKSEYLLAEKTRIEIEDLLTDAQRSVSFALVSLYKALGGGWPVCGVCCV